jgi:hypothetical protein
MSKARVGQEDIFIARVANADNITPKYHFNINRK